jgi:2-keto-4-pentenoate hydratase/2-oxohepta-3-ene-1,7-dioic acid hydratase in catechol pathway
MTLRDVQAEAKKKGLPWTLAKGFDTSAPVSEFVPASTVKNPHMLDLRLSLNGVVKQSSNTRHFIFKIESLISYISQFFTLEPGDILFTGTPEGVGPVRRGDLLEARLSQPDGGTLATLRVTVR